jgi:hypothetical protein
MKPFLKAIAVALPLSLGALAPGSAAYAQEQAMPSAEPQAVAERKRMLVDILTRALPTSRLPEIYADLRYALGELYLPALRDIVNDPEASKRDPETLAKISALVPVIDYFLRAAKELDPILSASREEIIADIAGHQAQYSSREEIGFLGEVLDTPATRKGFNAAYALSRCVTGYDQQDIRNSQEMSAWLKDWKFDAKANPFAQPDMPPPAPAKVAKAGAVVTDFLRVSRMDDMVSEVVNFLRNVVLQVDALKPEEAEMVRTSLQQFEFYYNLGKSMAVAIAPSGIAAAMTDDQLGKFHLMVLSPVMAKSFNLLYTALREATSFTKQDITEFRQLAAKGEAAGAKWKDNPELQAKMNAEWEELAARWHERLASSLTPETRQGLETALAAFNALVEEEAAKRKKEEAGEEDEEEDGLPSSSGKQQL